MRERESVCEGVCVCLGGGMMKAKRIKIEICSDNI